MKATLLFPTREIAEAYYLPLIYTACRTCYSELLPEDIFERATSGQVATEKQQDLIRRVIESGHGSTIEHIVFTFAISGVTRTLSHQLVRHRAGVAFDQQSQRYLNYKRPSYMVPGSLTDAPPEM
jgi:thymidylate synthase (FAD)